MSEFIDSNSGNGYGANAALDDERLYFDPRTDYFYSSLGCTNFQQGLPPCPTHQQSSPLYPSSATRQQWPSQTTPVYPGTLSLEMNYDYHSNPSYYGTDNGMNSPRSSSSSNVSPERTKPRFLCNVPGCGKSYSAAHNLQYHYRKHEDTKPFRCTNCGKSYRSRSDLTRHQKKAKVPCIPGSRS